MTSIEEMEDNREPIYTYRMKPVFEVSDELTEKINDELERRWNEVNETKERLNRIYKCLECFEVESNMLIGTQLIPNNICDKLYQGTIEEIENDRNNSSDIREELNEDELFALYECFKSLKVKDVMLIEDVQLTDDIYAKIAAEVAREIETRRKDSFGINQELNVLLLDEEEEEMMAFIGNDEILTEDQQRAFEFLKELYSREDEVMSEYIRQNTFSEKKQASYLVGYIEDITEEIDKLLKIIYDDIFKKNRLRFINDIKGKIKFNFFEI